MWCDVVVAKYPVSHELCSRPVFSRAAVTASFAFAMGKLSEILLKVAEMD